MRRSLGTRILTALTAVVFGFVSIQPLYADPCPHHEPAVAELTAGMSLASPMAEPAMATHGTEGAHNGHATHGGHAGRHDSGGCNCLGACCGTAAVALAKLPAGVVAAIVTLRAVPTPRSAIAPSGTPRPPHTLPFATAPPASLLAQQLQPSVSANALTALRE